MLLHHSNQKVLKKITDEFPGTVAVIEAKLLDDIKGERMKNIIPSIIIDIGIRLEVLLGSKLFGHTDTRTEASNLKDEVNQRGEVQTNSKMEMLFLRFLVVQKMELPNKMLKQIAFVTRLKIEKHMLLIMDKSIPKKSYLNH